MFVGTSPTRLDAYEKVTGRARYTEDCCPLDAYVGVAVHSEIANGLVESIDASKALALEGVLKVVTCFDSPEFRYDTGNHPWARDKDYQGALTQQILTKRVRYYGDPVAAVVARDELTAVRASKLIKITYREYEPLLTVESAMAHPENLIHEDFPGNIFAHSGFCEGDYDKAVKEPGLTKIDGWYEVPAVKHIQLEPTTCFAYMENGRLVIYSPTQTPHPHRRVIGEALGIPWGNIRVIKPYVGGGFGNREDSIYEPLCALLTTRVGGHCVRMKISREEDIMSTRTRHAIRFHVTSHVRSDGSIAARALEVYSNKGAYGHHGHAIACKAANAFKMLYCSDAVSADIYTVFTNTESAGAMRGYGAPQGVFAAEAHTDDICRQMGLDPIEFRRQNMLRKGDGDEFLGLWNYEDSLRECMDVALDKTDYFAKRDALKGQTGSIRKGIGFSAFWYNTGAWPFLIEASTNRMLLNQDGSVQVQSPEIEFGQGTDTAFAQMAADVIGVPLHMIHMVSEQDTDSVPFGSGAYASRQTYTGGAGIYKTGMAFKNRVLKHAAKMLNPNKDEFVYSSEDLDIYDGFIVNKISGEKLMTMEDVGLHCYYNMEEQDIISAAETVHLKSNALSLGCCIAEVTVDMKTGRIDVDDIINVHDCGTLINPVLARAQVHGGISMGIGYALSEKLITDPVTGRLLNCNMLDYKLPGAMDHPSHIQAAFVENPEPTTPFGTKGLGEPPAVPVAPAIRNAVLNATGVAFNELPMDPQTVLTRFIKEGLS